MPLSCLTLFQRGQREDPEDILPQSLDNDLLLTERACSLTHLKEPITGLPSAHLLKPPGGLRRWFLSRHECHGLLRNFQKFICVGFDRDPAT